MPEPAIDFSPLDSEGLREDLPNYRRKWSSLTNVIFKDGRLRPRPGFREPSDLRDRDIPSSARGIPLVIAEIYNPGDTITGRGGSPSFSSETLTPDGNTDGTTTGWSGAYTDIDETAPAGSDKMTTSTDGAQTRITFTNTSNTVERYPGITVFARLKCAYYGQRAKFNFYLRRGTTDYLVHTAFVGSFYDGNEEADDWTTIAFTVTRDPFDGNPFTKADIDATIVVVEYAGGESVLYEMVPLDADGNYTAWLDRSDDGTATYTDFDGSQAIPWEGETLLNGIYSRTIDAKQSWTFPSSLNSTFNSITQLRFFIWGKVWNEAKLRLFFRVGGTDYTIEDFRVKGRAGTTIFQATVDSTLNPADSAAWAETDIESGEFGIQLLDGRVADITSLQMLVEGLGSGTSVALDWMKIEVMETDGPGISPVIGRDPIWVTTTAMYRLADWLNSTVTNITNSVAVTEPANAPIDHATLFGQIYVVNGDDPTRRYPDSSNLFEALTTNDSAGTGAITGRTVAAFADRILYGWTDDATDGITPERIAYSNRNDGGDHSGASAGTLDLIGSEGGVVKLLPISEDVCVAYKEHGIYNIRQSGSSVAPLIPDLIDAFTGALGPRTVTATLSPTGTPIHLFLGDGPLGGQNVYQYDGSTVQAVGDGIQNSLNDNLNLEAVGNAFGVADPQEGLYYLFVPEGTDQFPEAGFIYHIKTGVWTRFTLPFAVTCAGIWSIPPVASGATSPRTPVVNAPRQVMVGTLSGRLLTLDFDAAYDSRYPPTPDTTEPALFSSDSVGVGEDRINFTSTIETGDPRPSDHPGQQVSAYRLHLVHNTHAPVPLDIQVSANGGKDYGSTASYLIGDVTDSNAYVHDMLSLNQKYSHRPRVKITIVPTVTTIGWNPRFDFAEMWLESQPQGDDA